MPPSHVPRVHPLAAVHARRYLRRRLSKPDVVRVVAVDVVGTQLVVQRQVLRRALRRTHHEPIVHAAAAVDALLTLPPLPDVSLQRGRRRVPAALQLSSVIQDEPVQTVLF